jgi:phosphoribosylaminoimidazolecarboxamide formyltransferase/IMP cyclohydrolase
MKRRALFSVYKKEGIDEFARFLSQMDYEVLSTGGTYQHLKGKGVPVTEVSEATGFPEVLDGRVKTLHPVVHAGILAMRDKKEHLKEIEEKNIAPIDFVVVNLYPFEETIQNQKSSLEEIIEQIDIGGVALIRAAAKNYKDVVVLVNNQDFEFVRKEMSEKGSVSLETKMLLAAKAFSHTAYYDGLISSFFNQKTNQKFPVEHSIPLKLESHLRYGENPHQEARLYKSGVDHNISLLSSEILWGKEMSYNNYLDADACLDILREFVSNDPFCVVIKHTNPCGAALGNTILDAFERAKAGDPVSAYGGIVGFNKTVDAATAAKMNETFFDIVLAPDYDEAALALLKGKKNLRILKLKGEDWSKQGKNYRRIENGFLLGDWDNIGFYPEKWEAAAKRSATESEARDLKFAWKIAQYVKSNAIVYVKNQQVFGAGAGQMSRVDSARIAAIKAQEFGFDLKGAVMASDAFFPFRDTVDNAAKLGITAIIQPGGSVRDADSIQAADENNMAMVFTGVRHFKH